MKKLLEVNNLRLSFSIQNRKLHAVQGVSFDLFENEVLGIVGESGCGKSVLMHSLLRLSPSHIESGSALFQGRDLLRMPLKQLRSIRGRQIGMIFQDSMTSLNPTMRIGKQILEPLLHHKIASFSEARERVMQLLKWTGLSHPKMRYQQFPHELSGGMRQRVLIAMALAAAPKLLIADEPTTALDPTIQRQILDLLKSLRSSSQMGQIIISHDMRVIQALCDRVLVMYAGKIVEEGAVQNILTEPRHPLTKMLLRSIPSFASKKGEKLFTIEGSQPSLYGASKGCSFSNRCPFTMDICLKKAPAMKNGSACWLHEKNEETHIVLSSS